MKYPAYIFRFLLRSLLYAGLYWGLFYVVWNENRMEQSIVFGMLMAVFTYAYAARQPRWKETWVLTQPDLPPFSFFSDPLFAAQAFREIGDKMHLRLVGMKTKTHRIEAIWEGKLGAEWSSGQFRARLRLLNPHELEVSIECPGRWMGRQWQASHKAGVHQLYAELASYISPAGASTPESRPGL